MRHWCRKVSYDVSSGCVDRLQNSSISSNWNSSGTQCTRSVACSKKSICRVLHITKKKIVKPPKIFYMDLCRKTLKSIQDHSVNLLLGKYLELVCMCFVWIAGMCKLFYNHFLRTKLGCWILVCVAIVYSCSFKDQKEQGTVSQCIY